MKSENNTSEQFHACEQMRSLSDPAPYFYTVDNATNTTTGETFTLVMVAIAGRTMYVACQVDYCPWCGTQLTAYTLKRSQTISKEKARYREYRRKHMRSGQLTPPVKEKEWLELAREYEETMFLLPYAKPENSETLVVRAKVLRQRLALDAISSRIQPYPAISSHIQPISEASEQAAAADDQDDFNQAKRVEDTDR